MRTEIQEHLKQIELALLKGTTPAEMVTHFAEVQKQFESLTEEKAAVDKRLAEEIKRRGDAIDSIAKIESTLGTLRQELVDAKATIDSMKENHMRWGIERTYAEKTIETLKDILSAAFTRSALKGTSMFDFSGYFPSATSGSSGNISGKGNLAAGEQIIKPDIK